MVSQLPAHRSYAVGYRGQDRTLARNFKEMCNRRPENNGPSGLNPVMITESDFLHQYDEVFTRQRASSPVERRQSVKDLAITTYVLVHQQGYHKEIVSVRSSEYSNRAEDIVATIAYSYFGLPGSLQDVLVVLYVTRSCSAL